jgi:hypothetical protein
MSTVALIIDYGNGAQKRFSNIPWTKDLTILGAIEAGARIPPSAKITFGSDRSGHVLGLEIDEMPGGGTPTLEWIVCVNEKPFNDRVGTETSFGFRPEERSANLLKAGDQVLIRLSAKPEGA